MTRSNIDLEKTIEIGKATLEALLEKYSEFLEKWQTEFG
jgi:hypothetical protein